MNHQPHVPDEGNFPANGTAGEKLQFVLHYALLAPSVLNTQPWQFKLNNDAVEIHADRSRTLPVVDPMHRELIISCGAALENLAVAIRHFGYIPEIRHFPDASQPDFLATIRLGSQETPSSEDALIFYALHRRSTHRKPFRQRSISPGLFPDLVLAASNAETWTVLIPDDEPRRAVADLIAEADIIQGRDPQFREELSRWLTPSGARRADGIPADVRGISHLGSLLENLLTTKKDLGPRRAATDRKLTENSPLIIVLGTLNDTPQSWLYAGRALAHLLLRARAAGVFASFFSQPVQVPETRRKLAALCNTDGQPQIVLRLGYGDNIAARTPRYAIGEVLAQPDAATKQS